MMRHTRDPSNDPHEAPYLSGIGTSWNPSEVDGFAQPRELEGSPVPESARQSGMRSENTPLSNQGSPASPWDTFGGNVQLHGLGMSFNEPGGQQSGQ